MASKHQFTGMTGLHLVAAELSQREFIVSPTSRSALTADLLVADSLCMHTYAVQVKTNAKTFNFWLVNPRSSTIISENLVYALVNLRKSGPEFYLIPSAALARKVRVSEPSSTRKSFWYSVYLKDIAEYKDNWSIFKNEGNSRFDTRPKSHPSRRRIPNMD